ncbi:MAG: lipoyl synthase [Rikenellaceae bacterium]
MPSLRDRAIKLSKPEWLKIRLHSDPTYAEVERIVKQHSLHTICSSGMCPNKAECWSRKTATFMLMGDVCTRNCRFCATLTGRPLPLDPSEPEMLAESVELMGLKHIVLTSVTRDDLEDGGAQHWVDAINTIRAKGMHTTIELLISDMNNRVDSLRVVAESGADIIGHNIETTRRLTPAIRSTADYARSLDVLAQLAQMGAVTKSGIMVGLGESDQEVIETLEDLRAADVKIVTLGQYLRPTLQHHPVDRYVSPERFEWYKEQALAMGFSYCASAPLVRSSYLADEALGAVRALGAVKNGGNE